MQHVPTIGNLFELLECSGLVFLTLVEARERARSYSSSAVFHRQSECVGERLGARVVQNCLARISNLGPWTFVSWQ